MTDNAVEVFGALRYADELELTIAELAKRTRKSWRAVQMALRDLHHLGLVERHRNQYDITWSIAHPMLLLPEVHAAVIEAAGELE